MGVADGNRCRIGSIIRRRDDCQVKLWLDSISVANNAGFAEHELNRIIGLTGRFPGARSVEQFWQNLRDGVEALTVFSDAELLEAGVDPLLLQNPSYVKARPILEDVAERIGRDFLV